MGWQSFDATGKPTTTSPTYVQLSRSLSQARLTTESGVPVSSGDRTSQGTLYLTPVDSGLMRVWSGTQWTLQNFAEVSLALSITADKNYDVFYNGTALSLSSAWTDDTTRADALGTQDGVPCLGSDHTKLHQGTIRASGSNVVDDSEAKRFVANVYNLVPRRAKKSSASSHSDVSSTARYWNNSSSNRLDFVVPYAQTIPYFLYADVTPAVTGNPAVYGIVDWTSGSGTGETDAVFGDIFVTKRLLDGTSMASAITAGRHYIAAVEIDFAGAVSSTFEQFRLASTLLI